MSDDIKRSDEGTRPRAAVDPRDKSSMMRNMPVVVGAILVVASLAVWFYRPTGSAFRVKRSVVTLPSGIAFNTAPAQFAVSPDGAAVAMNLRSPEGSRVWIWQVNGVDSRPLAGTDGVTSVPAWSPDGTNIAFVSGGRLRRMPAAGGPVQSICDLAPDATFDWGTDETILLASGGAEPIRRVAANAGDTVRQITRRYPDEEHASPKFVPRVRRFLFVVHADPIRDGVWAGSLDGGMARRLLPDATSASVAGQFIVYAIGQRVMAQRFDAETLTITGPPVTLADNVRGEEATRRLAYSVSAGTQPLLAFQSDGDGALHLTTGWPALADGQ